MTDSEIIKALECCGEMHECSICPRYDRNNDLCQEDLHIDALSLITSQKAEIEQLQKKYEMAVAEREANVKGFTEQLATIKSEARKEFAERLKEQKYQSSDWSHGEHPFVVEESDIDNLLEEMESESDV